MKGKPVPQQEVNLDDKDAVTAGLSALIAERVSHILYISPEELDSLS